MAGARQWCGFDPQNTLQAGDGRMLHMRFLNLCGGSITTAEFNQPVVEHEVSGLLETVLANTAGLVLTAEGSTSHAEPGEIKEVTHLRLESTGLTLSADRATIRFAKREWHVSID